MLHPPAPVKRLRRPWHEAAAPPVLTVDPRIEQDQVDRLRAFRAARDSRSVQAALERLEADAREDRNLIPPILASVSGGATLGEVVLALKKVFGEHRPAG